MWAASDEVYVDHNERHTCLLAEEFPRDEGEGVALGPRLPQEVQQLLVTAHVGENPELNLNVRGEQEAKLDLEARGG